MDLNNDVLTDLKLDLATKKYREPDFWDAECDHTQDVMEEHNYKFMTKDEAIKAIRGFKPSKGNNANQCIVSLLRWAGWTDIDNSSLQDLINDYGLVEMVNHAYVCRYDEFFYLLCKRANLKRTDDFSDENIKKLLHVADNITYKDLAY